MTHVFVISPEVQMTSLSTLASLGEQEMCVYARITAIEPGIGLNCNCEPNIINKGDQP